MSNAIDINEPLLTEQEAAKFMGVARRTLRDWRARRRIRCLILGDKTVRYRREHVEEFLRKCERQVRPPRRRA